MQEGCSPLVGGTQLSGRLSVWFVVGFAHFCGVRASAGGFQATNIIEHRIGKSYI